jgi:serine/threonine protein kinase
MMDVKPDDRQTDSPDAQNPSHVVGSFATTDAAKQACAVAWRDSPKANTDLSLKTHHHVSYNDIDFARAVQIGDGGSCTVFKTEVYGMPCAVKVLSKSAGAWEVRSLYSNTYTRTAAIPFLSHFFLVHTQTPFLSPLFSLRNTQEEQFSAEVEFLSRIHHENLCRLYACSTDGPQKCLLLELMDGALDSRLMALPSLGWEQRVWVALSSTRALSHLHARSPPVIHRDIKVRRATTSFTVLYFV